MTLTETMGIVTALSGLIAGGLYMRGKLAETTKTVTEHLAADAVFHLSIIDRLARIETKIDRLGEESE
jgi:hypothetical protein